MLNKLPKFLSVLIMAFSIFLVLSCENNDNIENGQFAGENHDNNLVEAIRLAQNAADVLSEAPESRDVVTRVVDESTVTTYTPRGRAGESLGELYFVNYKDEQGFAVVSPETEGVYALIDDGSYDPSLVDSIPVFAKFLQAAAFDASKRKSGNATPENPIEPGFPVREDTIEVDEWDDVNELKAHFVNLRWGQHDIYGKFCPNGLAGCSITAVAQLLASERSLQSMTLTYPGSGNQTIIFNWDAINSHFVTHGYSTTYYEHPINGTMSIECNASDTDHDAISHLCRQLGYSGKANYNTYSTGCYVDSIYSYLTKQYFQTKTFEYSNLQSLYSKLDSQACVLSGWVSNLRGGHSWIVDAYIDVNVETVRYTRAFGQKNWNILDRRFKENVKLYHLNLGWNGSANGYYKLGVADLGEYYSGDPNCGGGSNLQYLTDIRVYYFKDK